MELWEHISTAHHNVELTKRLTIVEPRESKVKALAIREDNPEHRISAYEPFEQAAQQLPGPVNDHLARCHLRPDM
jgi:hypothetical protein